MILILGVTASGKGRLALDLAESVNAEIISIDSMKVYRRMDIGTAKPAKQDRERVKYHLIDVVEPSESFSVGACYEQATEAITQIRNYGKQIIAVGGTALYIKALLDGLFDFKGADSDDRIRKELHDRIQKEGHSKLHEELSQIDPVAAERINPNDSKRIIRALEVFQITGRPISSFQKQWETHNSVAQKNSHNWKIIGLRRERTDTSSRINQRVKKMILTGLVDEVKSLLNEEQPLSRQARCAIGYAEIIEYLNGNINLKDATELIKKNTRRLAKGQRTWFKRFTDVHWLDVEANETHEKILTRAMTIINSTKT